MSTVAAYADRFMRSQLADARTVGMVGVVLGVLAFWLAIPPFTTRSFVWPVLVGALAVGAGIWAVSRGVGKLGWGAVAAGVVGICLAVLAIHSSKGNLEQVFSASLIASMLVFATPLTFAAI